jgi:hypothetical protein
MTWILGAAGQLPNGAAWEWSQVGEFEDLRVWVRERFGQLGKERGVAYAEVFRQIIIP